MLCWVLLITKKLKIVSYPDGEIHFIVKNCNTYKHSNKKRYTTSEAIKISRKEASKPLLLLREE